MTEQHSRQSNKALRLLQISDSHLYRDPTNSKLIGMNTEESLMHVLDLVKHDELLNGVPTFELILATGDISQDGSIESYRRFHELVGQYSKPIYYLPGNHDKLSVMKQAFSSPDQVAPSVIQCDQWSIVMLDSTIPGEVPGQFTNEELEALQNALSLTQGRPTAVCLHHHVLPMGSDWLDGVGLLEPEKFLAVLDRFDHVKAVINGHVHQDNASYRKGIPFFSLPSTCIQFKPKSQEFAVDTISPGYRWFDLYPDGTIQTGVSRVDGYIYEVDHSIKGY